MSYQPLIVDCTLREGEQHPGVCFSANEKIILANLLHEYGVDLIEIGHPGIDNESELHCSSVIRALSSSIITLVHARSCTKEIESAARTGADWVGIWISVNDLALETKFTERTLEWVMEQAKDSVSLAKKLGLKVRFTIEDASRTDWELMQKTIDIALSAGADRISLADTVGVWHPHSCSALIKKCKEKFNCPIEVHLHNDFGLALANAVAAIEAGVDAIDVSALGLGERAGITDLFQLTACLNQFYKDNRFSLSDAYSLSTILSNLIGFMPDPMRPIIGSHVFSHTSVYHQKAMKRNVNSYEGIKPEMFGQTRRFVASENRNENVNRFKKILPINKPCIKPASELQYHRDGPGVRWLMLDKRIDPRTSLYVIQRIFNQELLENLPLEEKRHVDAHVHHCPSVFIFWGNKPDGKGLSCRVLLNDEEYDIESPSTIYIPAGVKHSYYYIGGSGTYWNIVLAPDYNSSLKD